MININKQISLLKNGAIEDFEVAQELVNKGRTRHGLFFCHLALEKILKAHICKVTNDLAPRIHNLVRLSEITNLSLERKQIDVLAELNAFNIEGRYPDASPLQPTKKDAANYIKGAEEVFQWLMSQL